MEISEVKELLFEIWDKLKENYMVIFVCIIIGYIFFQRTKINYYQSEVVSLKEQKEKLILENNFNINTIQEYEKDYQDMMKYQNELANKNKSLASKLDEKNKIIYREIVGKTDIEELTKKKPTLIEKKVNVAIEEQIECLNKLFQGRLSCEK